MCVRVLIGCVDAVRMRFLVRCVDTLRVSQDSVYECCRTESPDWVRGYYESKSLELTCG